MSVVSSLSKDSYSLGEAFSSDGLSIIDTSSGEIVSDFTLSLNLNEAIYDGYVFDEVGSFELWISKEGYVDLDYGSLSVINGKALSLKRKPLKADYEVGDSFSLDGIVVYDASKDEDIDDYTSSILEGTALNELGNFEVTISKEDYKSTFFTISVNPITGVGSTRTLSIYSINDTHGAFERDVKDYEAGMSYIGEYLKEAKDNDRLNTLTISGGDMRQGGIESNKTRGKIFSDAMNIAEFDAMTIGNHEFDWGEKYIYENEKIMSFPLLGTNIFYKDTLEQPDFLQNSAVFYKGDLMVGVIGGVMEGIGSSILASISSKYDFPNPVEYVKAEAKKLKDEGCDVVIYSAHDSGYENKPSELSYFGDLFKEYKDGEKYIDGLFLAHDHRYKHGDYDGVPYLEAACNGEYIGKMSFSLVKGGDGERSITSSESEVDSAIEAATKNSADIDSLLNKYAEEIEDTDSVIYTFTRSYSRNEFVSVACQALMRFINNNKNIFGVEVDLTSHNFGGLRTEVDKGDMTYRDLFALCPFDNPVTIQTCDEENVAYMEYSSSWLCIYKSSSGVSYTDGVTYAGTISYVAEGNADFQRSYTEYPEYMIRDVLEAYLRSPDTPQL